VPKEGESAQKLKPEPEDEWGDCFSSLSFVGQEFPPPEEIIRGFLVPGLTIVAAAPKSGKTWLCHEFAIAIAQGRHALQTLPTRRADILCLFLEDGIARAIRRERTLLGNELGCPGIRYAPAGTHWSIKRISRYITAHPNTRVVIIDTAERFKQMQSTNPNGGSNVYELDYAFWGAFQELATHHNIAIIVIHHDRKPGRGENGNGGDLNSVSGSRGVTGSADHIWILSKNSETGIRTLKIEGRELEMRALDYEKTCDGRLVAIERDAREEEWENLRQQAMCLRAEGMSLRKIAEELGVSKSVVGKWVAGDGEGE